MQTSITPTTIRAQRAQEQQFNYGLLRQANGVFSVISRQGKVYEATTDRCSCPDFSCHGSKQTPNVPCKHIHLVREEAARLEAEELKRAARIAKARQTMALDFPI